MHSGFDDQISGKIKSKHFECSSIFITSKPDLRRRGGDRRRRLGKDMCHGKRLLIVLMCWWERRVMHQIFFQYEISRY